jgi:hypothetical protein
VLFVSFVVKVFLLIGLNSPTTCRVQQSMAARGNKGMRIEHPRGM